MKGEKIFLLLIFLVAVFLRFFHLQERAVFLGDQGRDLIEVREAILARKIPLAGPLSNEKIHTGPFYYYLIIPSLLLAKFQPTGPIFFFTALGVFTTILIYCLNQKIFGFLPAILPTIAYASSILVINRTTGLWNPIPIPFFTAHIILSLFKIKEERKLRWLPLLGIFLGITSQLYIPTYFLFLPTVLFWLSCFLETKSKLRFLGWSFLGIITLALTFLPFSIFQIQNDFEDLNNFFNLLFNQFLPLSPRNTSLFLPRVFLLLGQQFQAIFPFTSLKVAAFLGLVALASPLFSQKRKFFWHLFLSFWLVGGLVLLSLRPDSVSHHHYASFLWALPFFLFASFLHSLQRFVPKKVFFVLELILILLNTMAYFRNFTVSNDLVRAERIAILVAREAKNQPFFLLLLSDRSLSDSHIRYLLLLKGARVRKFDDENTDFLFLVCDKNNCPPQKQISNLQIVDSFCLPACPPLGKQRKIKLANWQFQARKEFWPGRKIYILKRAGPS